MKSINSKATPRAKKTHGGLRRPIMLTPEEYEEVSRLAEIEHRSMQNFMRIIFFQGLDSFKRSRMRTTA